MRIRPVTSLSFDSQPEQVIPDAEARQPILLTPTRVVYHRIAGSNPFAHLVSAPKTGGTGIVLTSVETSDGRLRAVATSGETVYFNGSRTTNSSGSRIYSGRVLAGASGVDVTQYSHWLGWTHKYWWVRGDSIVERMLRVEQAPNSVPSATHVNLQLVSVDAGNPLAQFPLTSWTNLISGLPSLGNNVIRAYTLPAFPGRSLLAADFQANLSGRDLYLMDTRNPGVFARKTLRNEVVP